MQFFYIYPDILKELVKKLKYNRSFQWVILHKLHLNVKYLEIDYERRSLLFSIQSFINIELEFGKILIIIADLWIIKTQRFHDLREIIINWKELEMTYIRKKLGNYMDRISYV